MEISKWAMTPERVCIGEVLTTDKYPRMMVSFGKDIHTDEPGARTLKIGWKKRSAVWYGANVYSRTLKITFRLPVSVCFHGS